MTMQVPMRVVAPPSDGFEGSPGGGSRIVDWLRRNFFQLGLEHAPDLAGRFGVSPDRPACLQLGIRRCDDLRQRQISLHRRRLPAGPSSGLRLHTFFWGHYPDSELWRLALAAALMVAFSVPVLRDRTRHRGLSLLLLLTVFPLLAGTLLIGGGAGPCPMLTPANGEG